MQTVYAVKCKSCIFGIDGTGIGKYVKSNSENETNKIIGIYLNKEAAIKCMRNFAKQKDDNKLNRTFFDDAVLYEGEINGKWHRIAYNVRECTLIEAAEH